MMCVGNKARFITERFFKFVWKNKMSFQAHKVFITSAILIVLSTKQPLWAAALSLAMYTLLKPSERGILFLSF